MPQLVDEPPEARYENLPLDDLHFDPENPRFTPGTVSESTGGPLAYLAQHSNLIDLIVSIGAQGYFPGEPIMVTPRPGGGFMVIEGNRRFAACILLSHPDRAPSSVARHIAAVVSSAEHHPSSIPSLVFQSHTDILRYLGFRHISGVREWSPLAKSLYAKRMLDEIAPDDYDEATKLNWVSRRIGVTPTYVAKLLTSLSLYERSIASNFFGLPMTAEDVSFSLITVAIGRRSINQFLGLQSSKDFHAERVNDSALRELFDWLFVKRGDPPTTILGESRNIGLLAEILGSGSTEGVEALRSTGDLEHAALLVQPDSNDLEGLFRDVIATAAEIKGTLLSEDRALSATETALCADARRDLGDLLLVDGQSAATGL